MLDGVNVSWARTQKATATSSGKSELYAVSVGTVEALGLRELLIDIGLPTTVRLRCDSAGAMGTATGATYFGQFRLWPGLSSTLANFYFGQFHFGQSYFGQHWANNKIAQKKTEQNNINSKQQEKTQGKEHN